MPNTAGTIVINVSAGTAQMVVDLERAKGKLRDFASAAEGTGRGVTSSMAAASGGIRLLEGNIQNNTRAVEHFLTQTLKLGPVIQAAFPLIGGAAFLGLLVKMGTEAAAFYQKMAEAPQRIATAFRVLNESSRLSNDQMQLANDKLEADIAKLQGKRQNNLKIALDEAKVSADELAKSLDTALANLQKLAKEENLGFWKSLAGTQRSTDGNDEGLERLRDQVASAMATGNANIRKAGTDTTARDAAEAERNIHLQNIYNGEIERRNALLKEAQKLQDYHDGKNQAPTYQQYVHAPKGTYAPYGIQATTPDQSVFIKQQQGAIEQLQYELDSISLNTTSEKDKTTKAAHEGDPAARKLALETTAQLTERLEKARESQAGAIERIDLAEIAEVQHLNDIGQATEKNIALVKEQYDFERLAEYNRLMKESVNIHLELGSAVHKVSTEEAAIAIYGEQWKEAIKNMEDRAKAVHEWALEQLKVNAELRSEQTRHSNAMADLQPGSPLQKLGLQLSTQQAAIESTYQEKLKGELSDREKGIAIQIRDNELLRARNQYEEEAGKLRQKNLNDFMIEMQGTAQSAGNILYQAAHSTLDTVSSDLAKDVTGRHKQAHWGQDAKNIGGNMVQSAIKSALQMALGHFGKHIHKPTFNPGDAGHVIVDNMPNGGGNLPGGPTIANASGVPGMAGVAGRSNSVGSALGGIFGGLLQGLLGGGKGASGAAQESVTSSIQFLADGGDVYPGRNYVVGDGGEPEMFSPGVRGTVTPFSKMGGAGGNTYVIDARGTDPVLTEMRVRQAVLAAHQSAVASGIQANAEQAKRTVQR